MLTPDTLENYVRSHQIEWADELPTGCPPSVILIPNTDEFYRLIIDSEQITEDDFKSYLELYPEKNYQGYTAVQASGLSIYDTYPDQRTRNLPALRKFKGVAKLVLSASDGVMIQSGSTHHYTWWRSKSFDISTAAIIEDENA